MGVYSPVGPFRAAVIEPAPSSVARLTRHVSLMGIAGVVAGVLAGGIGSRLFMRFAAIAAPDLVQGFETEAGFEVGEITLGGTIAVVIFVGILLGIIGAVLYVVFRPWLEWAGRARGLVFGTILFAIGSATSDALNPDNPDFFILRQHEFLIAMILALFLLYGVTIEWLSKRLDARAAPVEIASGGRFVMHASVVVLGAVQGIPLLFAGMFSQTLCGCEPPRMVGVFVVTAALGTIAWCIAGTSPRFTRLRAVAPPLGYIGLIGATIFGLTRAISDVNAILT